MANEIVELDIAKGVATYYSKHVEGQVDLADYLAKQRAAAKIVTPVLPTDCYKYSKNNDVEVFGVYKPAGWLKVGITLHATGNTFEGTGVPILVPPRVCLVPFVAGVCYIHDAKYAFIDVANRESLSRNSTICCPWLPNTYSTPGNFCGGTGYEPAIQPHLRNKITAVDAIVQYMEDSHFNNHLPEFRHWVPQAIANYGGLEDVDGFFDGPFQANLDTRTANDDGNHGWILNLLYKISKHLTENLGEEGAKTWMTERIVEVPQNHQATLETLESRTEAI